MFGLGGFGKLFMFAAIVVGVLFFMNRVNEIKKRIVTLKKENDENVVQIGRAFSKIRELQSGLSMTPVPSIRSVASVPSIPPVPSMSSMSPVLPVQSMS